jgi:hypothetical protein
MKCATSTLHEQLALHPGFFMTDPKEPQFFSDDSVYARGPEWYSSLFEGARQDDLCGESSTHYTKLPTHPNTVERMQEHLPPETRFIYIMRHPIHRLVSQYIHEWTQGLVDDPINAAVDTFPGLVEYGCYAMQLEPYLHAFGRDRILPIFFESLTARPQHELDRVARFLGIAPELRWQELEKQNVSAERMRVSPLRDLILDAPVLSQIRRSLVPKSVRNRIKQLWMMKERPTLDPSVERRLVARYDADLARLGEWLGIPLSCSEWKTQALAIGDSGSGGGAWA